MPALKKATKPWDKNVIGIEYQMNVVVKELGSSESSSVIFLQDIGNLFRRKLYSEDSDAIDIVGKPRPDSPIPEPPQPEIALVECVQRQLRLL
jgi:hypothetical protein